MDPDDIISDDIPCMGDDPDDSSLEPETDNEGDQFLSDGEADEDAMTSAGHGENESYGYYGEDN